MHKYFEQFKVVSIILQGLSTFFEGGNPCKIKLFTKLSTFSTKMPDNFLFSAQNRMCFLFGKNDEKCRISEKALTKKRVFCPHKTETARGASAGFHSLDHLQPGEFFPFFFFQGICDVLSQGLVAGDRNVF